MKKSVYHNIEQNLLAIDAFTDAAETHGVMCGFICAGANDKDQHWMQTVLNPIAADDEDKTKSLREIIALYEQTFTSLQDLNLDLELLLPDEDSELTVRAQALRNWCQGFLSGIALGCGTLKHSNPDIQEIILDLTEISKLDIRDITGTNEEETQFFELTEHVRMSTLLLHTLLQAPNESKPH